MTTGSREAMVSSHTVARLARASVYEIVVMPESKPGQVFCPSINPSDRGVVDGEVRGGNHEFHGGHEWGEMRARSSLKL